MLEFVSNLSPGSPRRCSWQRCASSGPWPSPPPSWSGRHRPTCRIIPWVPIDIHNIPINHRESTTREVKGGVTSSLKLNLTDPCRIVSCRYHCWGMPGRQAGSPFAVNTQVQCREPKTGPEKVQFYCEDDWLFLSSYYLSMPLLDC